MNCPYCGSAYTNPIGKSYSEKETVEEFVCDSCKKNFTKKLSGWSVEVHGKFLMRFDGPGFTIDGVKESPTSWRPRVFEDFVELYKLSDGRIKARVCTWQKEEGSGNFLRTIDLQRKVREEPFIEFDLDRTHPDYPMIVYYRDYKGTIQSICFVSTIRMNDELTKKALENEAMRISYDATFNKFVVKGIKNEERIKDMVSWFEPYMKKKEEVAPQSSGCYIATAVYGSYNCPEVWTLRRFRDHDLAETWYGRVFIQMYYAISPTLVKVFGNKQWFKSIWKKFLDRMVADLNEQGVENTPYEDRRW